MYDPTQDPIFIKTLHHKKLSKDTIQTYKNTCKAWYRATKLTLSETITEIKPTQHDRIDNNYIIRYNPDDSLLNDYFDKFYYDLIQLNRSKHTIKLYLKIMRYLLQENGLILPKQIKIKTDKQKKSLLTKNHIKYVLSISDIHYKALYTFLASTGIRISDVAKFTLQDFVDATSDYHNCKDITSFINTKHDGGMIGYWEFTPQKTRNSSQVVCKVCNSEESTKYILDSIYEKNRIIRKKNDDNNTNIMLEGNDPLFSTQQGYYKKKINREAVVTTSINKNNKLQSWLKNNQKKSYEKGEITLTDLKKLQESNPKFHAHALRHFFVSTTRAYCTNRDVSLIMEAHSSSIQTDVNYVGESKELFNKDMIINHYLGFMKHLTFDSDIDPVELDKLSVGYRELVKENERLKKEVRDEANLVVRELMKDFWLER